MDVLSYVARKTKDGFLEIQFNRKASEPTRDRLKNLGYRFHFPQHVWRGQKNHDEAIAVCERAVRYSANAAQRKTDTLCWDCAKSGYGGVSECPWERDFEPVEGWEAERNDLNSVHASRNGESYCVKACPLFEKMDMAKDRLAQAAVWW